MRRTGFARPDPVDPTTGERRFSTFKRPEKPGLVSTKTRKPLERTAMKRKRRKPKPGDDPLYKAWVKTQPCVVCGRRCGKVDPHHLSNGKDEARAGMGQTAPDRFLLPMCRARHEDFHHRRGFCAGWDDAQRLTFQEQEVERLRAIWDDLQLLGVLQEPETKAI
jgi:hypothetical protein